MVHRNTRSRKAASSAAPAVAAPEARGTKRKRATHEAGEGSDGEPEEGGDRSRSRTSIDQNPVKQEQKEKCEVLERPNVCICPKNVMKCIGILPSLPIMNQFCDSDDSDSSSNEDFCHTILPTVSRNHSSGDA